MLHPISPDIPLLTHNQTTSRKAPTLRNHLGYPNLSSFGTFAYCASSHLDKDDSATSGFVMKRPSGVGSFNLHQCGLFSHLRLLDAQRRIELCVDITWDCARTQ